MMAVSTDRSWPTKRPIIGVGVSATTYEEACELVLRHAEGSQPASITALAVHGLVEAARDEAFREVVSAFELVTPDGQPVRAALRLLHGISLPSRVYGPELMWRLCKRSAEREVGVYLYGSRPSVVRDLRRRLERDIADLNIVGAEPSKFRPLTDDEVAALGSRIASAGAQLVFLGLGCPLQERFAHRLRSEVSTVNVCVGAAFDFLSGHKRTAPSWMQKSGLEWLFRLMREPRRLWRRYLVTNSYFLMNVIPEWIAQISNDSRGDGKSEGEEQYESASHR